MKRIKELISKYKIILSIFVFLVASFFIYLFVTANEDIYENQIKVSNTRVDITSGTANFDGNDEPGNDSSATNTIVRNFDQVTYTISYDLGYKEDSTLDDEDKSLDVTRDVIIDVFVPTSIYMKVAVDGDSDVQNSDLTIQNNDTEYKYYSIEVKNAKLSETNTTEIVLLNINGKNGDVISPIIRVREATDEVSDKNITTSTNVSAINKLNLTDIRISAVEKYGVRLYQGVIEKAEDNSSSSLPLGIAIYIPNDSNKGIKGVQIPSSVNFNLNISATPADANSSVLDGATIANYTSDCGHVVDAMPYSYTNNNGRATVANATTLNENGQTVFPVSFSNLVFTDDTTIMPLSSNESVYYLSTKVLTFKNERASNYHGDIEYNITTNSAITNSIEDYLDNYVAFIGDFTSKIDFFNSATSTDSEISFVDSGKAIYNYNEEFYIQNTINYGLQKGDALENGYTNYVKIDNTAFQLEDVGNVSDASLDYYIQFGADANESYMSSALYGLGDWNLNYFKVKADAPSYCPTTAQLSAMNAETLKEKLMNLYGGPCVETTNVQWVESLQDAADANKSNKVIIFKLDVIDSYDTGVPTIVRLKAKALKNYSNVGKTFSILARGETTNDGQTYYLSEIPKKSVSQHSEDIRYEKTTYNANEITGGNKSYGNGGVLQNNIGNTVLISAFKAVINPIEMYDTYGSNKTIFHSGITDPIEFKINPVIYKSDFNSTITGATVSVFLPEQLEIYEKSGDKQYDRTTSGGTVTIDGVNYKQYNYNYSESDINFENESVSGTIPILNVHAYIAIATPDRTDTKVLARISGTLKPNTDATTVYRDVSPVSLRTTSASFNIRNTKLMNSIGKANTTRIDKNGTYTYNMRAANNSNASANLSMLYILPYSGDGVGDGSKFDGTMSVSLTSALPAGYAAYYTTSNSKTLLNNEIDNPTAVNWTYWPTVTTAINNATAIKIVATSALAPSNYFVSKDGVTVNVKTNGNKESDKYYNDFYIIQRDAQVCVDNNMIEDCSRMETKNLAYTSNISEVSVYNRKISGYAFEDQDYSGFYEKVEPRLKDIPVDLYKLSATTFDAKNPASAVSENDTLVEDGLTDKNGYYEFDGLPAGNYYVKYTFDCDKYTVTEKNKVDINVQGDASTIDSDAQMIENNNSIEPIDDEDEESDEEETVTDEETTEENDEPNVCYAVSNILTLNNNNIEYKNIDLGLRVRQDFDIKMRKYITNVTVTSNKGVQSYDYKNQSKVKIDIKNLKNTSFKVTYGIEIENSKYFPGTIGNIIETIPEGMTFDPNLIENDGWYESDGNLYYSYLNKTLIMPGEKYHLKIVLNLTTNNGGDYINFVAANNLQIKPVITNFLEIPETTESIISDDPGDDDYGDDDEYYDDDEGEGE